MAHCGETCRAKAPAVSPRPEAAPADVARIMSTAIRLRETHAEPHRLSVANGQPGPGRFEQEGEALQSFLFVARLKVSSRRAKRVSSNWSSTGRGKARLRLDRSASSFCADEVLTLLQPERSSRRRCKIGSVAHSPASAAILV